MKSDLEEKYSMLTIVDSWEMRNSSSRRKNVEEIISNFHDISGLWQVSGEKISKYQILSMLKEKLNRTDIEILRNEEYICDRSLSNTKILNATNYKFPSWDKMLDHLSIEIRKRRKLKNDIKR